LVSAIRGVKILKEAELNAVGIRPPIKVKITLENGIKLSDIPAVRRS